MKKRYWISILASALLIAVLLVTLLPAKVSITEGGFLSISNSRAYANPGGMKSLIIGGYADALSKTAAEYNTLQGGFSWTTTAATRKQSVSTPGTFSNLSVELSAAPGDGGSYTITLLNVTQSTSLAVTITDPSTTGLNTGILAAVAGDIIQLQSTYSAPSATPTARWSIIFEGNNAKESLILGSGQTRNTANRYCPLMVDSNSASSNETDIYQIIPTPGTIKNLFVALSADPGDSPDAYRFTLRVNGQNSDDGDGNPLQVTITADNTEGSDTTYSIPVAAGDYVNLMIEPLDTPATDYVNFWHGMTFVADTDGESIILGQSSDKPTLDSTEYNYLTSVRTAEAWSGTENYQGGQSGITLKKFYVMLGGTSTGTYTLNVRATSAEGNTGIGVVVAIGQTTGSDTTNTYNIGAYDDLSISCLAVGTARLVYWGLVCYIPPSLPSIENTPDIWTIGHVQVNDVRYFSADNTQDDDYATVTNTGSVPVNVAIQGADIDGGDYDWTLASAAGNKTYSLYANTPSGGSTYSIEVKKSSYNNLCTNLGIGSTYKWSMKFTAPSAFDAADDGLEKSATVTLVASAAG